MSIKVGLLAEYKKIFPELDDSIEFLSQGIPTIILKKVATSFLALQTLDNDPLNCLEVLNKWFGDENLIFKQNISNRIHSLYPQEDCSSLKFCSPVSSLKILQIAFNKNFKGPLKNKNQIEIDIFKIYLILNQSIVELESKSNNFIKNKYPNIYLGVFLLNMSFSTSDLTNFIKSREFFCQSTKLFFLASFLAKNPKVQIHVKEFFKKFNINSFQEYYAHLWGLLPGVLDKKKEGFIEFTLANLDDRLFFDKIAIQSYLEEDDVDFRVIRENPLIKMDEKTYRITHPIFITDKIFKSLYFELSKIDKNLPEKYKLPSFRSFYTTEFSEKYLLFEVMGYCIKNRYISFTGLQIDAYENIIKGGPDYYVRNGKHILLVENKDVFINGQVKEMHDFQALEYELQIKFLKKANGKGVGIKQIIKNIEKVLLLKNKYDLNYNPDKVLIYPLLIVHDISFDCPGINTLLNYWFNEEVEQLKEKGFNTINIKPLIVLNIDTLIRVSEVLRTNNLNFKSLFDIYYKKIKQNRLSFNSQKQLENAFTGVHLSSSSIIEDWLHHNWHKIGRKDSILNYAFKKMND